MTDQIVITEKSSQAKDVRAAVGGRYGAVLPAEGHLLDLCEPEDVNPAWKRWSAVLLRPDELYGTKPASGGNKAAKLKAIRAALRTATRVWLATDCDREGQLIGQEILEHCGYRGEVLRVLFTAQDAQTIREAFGRARPNSDHARLYAAAVARRQADQIYNLSLTRTATVTLGRGARGVIGVGRVKTPTLAIACKRELEIRDFVPVSYFEIVAAAHVEGGTFRMRHAPKDRILKRENAETVVRDFEGRSGGRGQAATPATSRAFRSACGIGADPRPGRSREPAQAARSAFRLQVRPPAGARFTEAAGLGKTLRAPSRAPSLYDGAKGKNGAS